MAKENYSSWSKEDLVKEVKKFKKRKKYGVLWETKPEEVVEMCKQKFPVLVEDQKRQVETDEKKPTNILIEGDNYHALSVLNYTHKGKIDVIFIDPPYNTGNGDAFRFNDRIVDKEDAYRHSKWLSFMEKRLRLAKNLLRNNGAIFISIDDNELAQLKLLCDEIFGEDNLAANIVWQHSIQPKGYTNKFSVHHNYILSYRKSNAFELNALERKAEHNVNYSNPDNDPNGKWRPGDVRNALYRPNLIFNIKTPSGKTIKPPKNGWRWSKQTIDEKIKSGEIVFSKDETRIIHKIYLNQVEGRAAETIWFGKDVGTTREAAQELKDIFDGESPFETPKPTRLLVQILKLHKNRDAIVLDFFAGSGTTGHAVLNLNNQDNGKRQFILCTNDENNICTEVCYPRVKRVIQRLEKEAKGKLISSTPGGMRYYKTEFIDGQPTDSNKKKLVDRSTEMLCLKEHCFDEVKKGKHFKVFSDGERKLMGIIYDDDGIGPFKKEVKKAKKKFAVYMFSLDESAREDEFEDVQDLVELKPIPAVILNVYKRIFK